MKISFVVPSTGNLSKLTRCLNSIIECDAFFESSLDYEIIVYLNLRQSTQFTRIRDALSLFFKEKKTEFRLIESDRFHWTAEESAFHAMHFATGEYVCIVGDQRIFTKEGLSGLVSDLRDSVFVGYYLNSSWVDSRGFQLLTTSTRFRDPKEICTYKEFVLANGFNYMPTNFGAWVIKREFYNLKLWEGLAKETGWHFSHVALLLRTLENKQISSSSTYAILMEQKDYHGGDSTGWEEYTRENSLLRFDPWVRTLAHQISNLLSEGHLTSSDLRTSTVAEGSKFHLFMDEIVSFTAHQIRLGFYVKSERLSKSDFLNNLELFKEVYPDRKHISSSLERLYLGASSMKKKTFEVEYNILLQLLQNEYKGTPLKSLIIADFGDYVVRQFRSDLILSRKNDTEVLNAYKETRPAPICDHWLIASDLVTLRKLLVLDNSFTNLRRFKEVYGFVSDVPPSSRRRFNWMKMKVEGFFIVLLRYKVFIILSSRLSLRIKRWLRTL